MMNTSEVAKFLGVSSSTIQRWVKQLDLPTERNDRGHYLFSEQNIEILKGVQAQIQNGTLLQDITPIKEKKIRQGVVKEAAKNQALDQLYNKIYDLERNLNAKADSVTSYQILQHRSDIEELQSQVEGLTNQLLSLQTQMVELQKPMQIDHSPVFDEGRPKKKKKNFVSSLFGF